MVRQVGLEPTTNGLENHCSIQLSYWRFKFKKMVDGEGFEPPTYCV